MVIRAFLNALDNLLSALQFILELAQRIPGVEHALVREQGIECSSNSSAERHRFVPSCRR
jgi:hypothetical protein